MTGTRSLYPAPIDRASDVAAAFRLLWDTPASS
jgi:hypothetical protein